MKDSIERPLTQYGLILGILYQLYQSVFDVFLGAHINAIFINIIVTLFFLLLLALLKLQKSVNLVAGLLHLALLPAFVYFWYYNGGINGLVPYILCMYSGFIIASTTGAVKIASMAVYFVTFSMLLFFPEILMSSPATTPLNLDSKPIDYLVVALLITAFVVYLKNKYLYYRRQVAIRNEQLERVALTLFNQNEELTTQQEEIKSINENLEALIADHTRGIESKNRELSEYAFINAHMLRGPLSRILGLTNLMENDPGNYPPADLKRIRESAQEIDRIIKEINAVLN